MYVKAWRVFLGRDNGEGSGLAGCEHPKKRAYGGGRELIANGV
jgi:hypothetical protein